jgi:hypothetical protein
MLGLLFDSSFGARLLRRELEDTMVDDSIGSELAARQTADIVIPVDKQK